MEVSTPPPTPSPRSGRSGPAGRSGSAASTTLGCGRDIDDVWDNATKPPTAHEADCAECQAARESLAPLAAATAQLRDHDQTDPDLQPGPRVLDRILTVARSEVRRGRQLPLQQPAEAVASPITISEQAVSSVIRRVGDRSHIVQIRRCAVDLATQQDNESPIQTEPATRPGGPASVRLSLRVSIASGYEIANTVQTMRSAIIAAVHDQIGLIVTTVDVSVEDLHD